MVLREERKGVEKKFYELCLQVVKDNDLGLYDLDYIYGSSTLRVFIINEETGTAQLDECVKIDRALGPFFDSEDWIPSSVTLEVSSPGLYRILNTLDHFKSAVDQNISITLKKKLETSEIEGLPKSLHGQKKVIVKLLNADDEKIEIAKDDFRIKIKYQDIKKANVEADLNGVL